MPNDVLKLRRRSFMLGAAAAATTSLPGEKIDPDLFEIVFRDDALRDVVVMERVIGSSTTKLEWHRRTFGPKAFFTITRRSGRFTVPKSDTQRARLVWLPREWTLLVSRAQFPGGIEHSLAFTFAREIKQDTVAPWTAKL